MRRLLLVPLLLLAGCGSDDTEIIDVEPAPEPAAYELLGIVHETAAGGTVSTTASPVDAAYLSGLDPDLAEQVRALAGDREAYAAVVMVGCDVPTDVVAERDGDSVTIRAQKVPDPLPECFAPVTSVAVVAYP